MLKKLLAGASAIALSLGMIALVAGPATAHTGDLSVTAVCNTSTGEYDFTAKLTISQTNETGATYWKVGTSSFTGTPTSAAGLPNGPVASSGATTITLTTFSLPGTTTGLGPWVYAFTTWTPDNYTKGSDGQLLSSLDGSCSDTPDSKKISFCHWDGGSGKYSAITTSLAAFYVSGHIDHDNDIYPAGSIVKHGVTHSWPAQGNQAQLQYEDCLIPITPTAPSFVTAVCTNGTAGDGSYTIPTTAGVSYFVNGSSTAKPAGTYSVTPVATISIVAKLTAGNTSSKLTGTTTWSHTFDSAGPCVTTPATPTVTDQVCSANTDGNGVYTSGYITIPAIAHVEYSIDGTVAAAGQHNLAPGTYTVTAVGTDGYGLTGYPAGGWSKTITAALACDHVTPVAPTVTDEVCTNDDGDGVYTSGFITIPSSSKVNYFINGSPASAGDNDLAPGDYTVTAEAVPDYTLVGYPAGGWPLTIESAVACGDVTPTPPSVSDETCKVNTDGNGSYTSGEITIPVSTKVNYFIDGTPASSGAHSYANGTYTVTAVAVGNYVLTGYPAGGWSETINAASPCGNVASVDPVVADETCVVIDGIGSFHSGYIDLPAAGIVSYFIDGLPAGTHNLLSPGTYTVTATVVPNYTLTGYPVGGWSETIHTALACGNLVDHPIVTPDVSVVQLGCSTAGSYTLSNNLGDANAVFWTVDGSPVSQGTYQVTSAKTVHVHVDANGPDFGFTFGQQQDWTLTFAAATTCDLKTLALTGTQPAGGMLLAYFMLLAGLGIVAVRAVRRHGRPQE